MMGTLQEVQYMCFIVPHSILLTIRNITDKFIGKVKAQFMLSDWFTENGAVYNITWKNLVEPGKPQYGACTLRAEYVRLQTHTRIMKYFFLSIAKTVAQKRLKVTLYEHWSCCVTVRLSFRYPFFIFLTELVF